jgi:D-3-phosphoglycerate dehydrogenase
LRDLPNVILTPHIGSYAKESRAEMEMQAVQNLLAGLINP